MPFRVALASNKQGLKEKQLVLVFRARRDIFQFAPRYRISNKRFENRMVRTDEIVSREGLVGPE
jgi:hypothetical protein